VPGSGGGTLELAQAGHRLRSDLYLSYRHFQAASNELVTPKLLVCPADTRVPATNFGTLSNTNLSYFIGVNAEFARSTSVLAGDRNLTNDYAAPGSPLRLGLNYALRWTEELHRFKGNLLFSDGHVEQKNNFLLLAADGQVPAIANLALPTARQPAPIPSSRDGRSSPWTPAMPEVVRAPESGSFTPATNAKTAIGSISFGRPGSRPTFGNISVRPAGIAVKESPSAPSTEKRSTNIVSTKTMARRDEENTSVSPYVLWLAVVARGLAENALWWFYGLLLLLVAAILVLRKVAWDRRKRKTKPPGQFP